MLNTHFNLYVHPSAEDLMGMLSMGASQCFLKTLQASQDCEYFPFLLYLKSKP